MFTNKKNWVLLPIKEIKLTHVSEEAVSGYETTTFGNISNRSSYSITPILRSNDEGFETPVAYKFEGTFYILQNNYGDMVPTLRGLLAGNLNDFDMPLSPNRPQIQAGSMWITIDGTIIETENGEQTVRNVQLKKWRANWHVEQSEPYPFLVIEVKGLFSKDAFEINSPVGSPVFNQISGWQ